MALPVWNKPAIGSNTAWWIIICNKVLERKNIKKDNREKVNPRESWRYRICFWQTISVSQEKTAFQLGPVRATEMHKQQEECKFWLNTTLLAGVKVPWHEMGSQQRLHGGQHQAQPGRLKEISASAEIISRHSGPGLWLSSARCYTTHSWNKLRIDEKCYV